MKKLLLFLAFTLYSVLLWYGHVFALSLLFIETNCKGLPVTLYERFGDTYRFGVCDDKERGVHKAALEVSGDWFTLLYL